MPDYAVGFAGLLVFTNLSKCLMECNYLLCKTVLIPGIIGSIMTWSLCSAQPSMPNTFPIIFICCSSFIFWQFMRILFLTSLACRNTLLIFFSMRELQKPACFAIFSWKLGKWNVRLRHDFLICTIGNHGIFCHFVIVVSMRSFDSQLGKNRRFGAWALR